MTTLQFRGPARYRLRSAAGLSQSVLEVSVRRVRKGPRLPGWNWYVEVANEVAKRQTLTAFGMEVGEARRYRLRADQIAGVIGNDHYSGCA